MDKYPINHFFLPNISLQMNFNMRQINLNGNAQRGFQSEDFGAF
jgi:hypothetical protein